MEYELPEAQYIPTANIEVPLLSILGENKAGDHRRVPRRLQLVECERQARIAALHIDRAWALTERHAGPSDDTLVWAELQGAMTAGIILSRMLRPTGVRPRAPLSRTKSEKRSADRGAELRGLLSVEEESPLLKISAIRDPIEHFDERIDRAVEQGAVSVSDFFIAKQGYLATGPTQLPDGRDAPRTVALRVFAPWPGLLIFDGQVFDLFAYEEALHRLIDQDYPRAVAAVIHEEREWTNSHFGSAQQLAWRADDVERRRARWASFREGRSLSAPTGL
ncbi:hypothetical protein ACF049_19070 [Cellulosimicrobium funkei]|uniref:hypothetical protein n=1 Tax=Cellulosimicrobium funkei TaxID=264251 RepID=UPI0004E455B2|nr:hypothetical protein [Cellulosimicrobium sp. MM]KFD43965.1 hypothetical protein IU11_06555 [Cellulosimicrobium sp. MM]